MPNDQFSNDASTSSGCKKHLVQLRRMTSSTSNHIVSSNLKQLEGRLKILEEEAEMLKGALLESVEESKTLITDLHLHFDTIQSCLLQRGESYSHGVQIGKERRRAGLMQILYHDSNPYCKQGFKNQSIITRFNLSSF